MAIVKRVVVVDMASSDMLSGHLLLYVTVIRTVHPLLSTCLYGQLLLCFI